MATGPILRITAFYSIRPEPECVTPVACFAPARRSRAAYSERPSAPCRRRSRGQSKDNRGQTTASAAEAATAGVDDELAALILPPRRHCHRYHRALAPTAPWREEISANPNGQACLDEPEKQAVASKDLSETTASVESRPLNRPGSHCRRVALLARTFEILPLTCPQCGQELRSIAILTEAPSV